MLPWGFPVAACRTMRKSLKPRTCNAGVSAPLACLTLALHSFLQCSALWESPFGGLHCIAAVLLAANSKRITSEAAPKAPLRVKTWKTESRCPI